MRILNLTLAIAGAAVVSSFAVLNAQTKEIHVVPSTAKIYLNGSEVGNGNYKHKFNKKQDFVMLKFEAPSYITKEVKLLRTVPQKTLQYTLAIDEAEAASVGAGEGIDIANRWFDVNSRAGMDEDQAWKRLMGIVLKYFDNVEIRDKAAGWIKTSWALNEFTTQIVRTNLEVKILMGDDDLKYRARITSEIADRDCGKNDQCFRKYGRVLKRYEKIIEDLQNTLGGNN